MYRRNKESGLRQDPGSQVSVPQFLKNEIINPYPSYFTEFLGR